MIRLNNKERIYIRSKVDRNVIDEFDTPKLVAYLIAANNIHYSANRMREKMYEMISIVEDD